MRSISVNYQNLGDSMANGTIKQFLPMVPTVIIMSASDMGFDPKLSLYGENKVISFGRLNIAFISVKIDSADSKSSIRITNFLPVGYRPSSIILSAIVSTGLGDGKAQDVNLRNTGSLEIFPTNLNVVTYAIGTVVYTT